MAWEGATISIFKRALDGQLTHGIDAIGKFLVRWNLQAMGLPQETVEEALEALDRLIQKGDLS